MRKYPEIAVEKAMTRQEIILRVYARGSTGSRRRGESGFMGETPLQAAIARVTQAMF